MTEQLLVFDNPPVLEPPTQAEIALFWATPFPSEFPYALSGGYVKFLELHIIHNNCKGLVELIPHSQTFIMWSQLGNHQCT